MDRRRFLLTSLAGAFSAPLAGEAQQAGKMPRIGFLGPPPGTGGQLVQSFQQGLSERGYIEGRNITIEYRWTEALGQRRQTHPRSSLDLLWKGDAAGGHHREPISEYKAARLWRVRTIGKGETASERRLSTATVNRALALLRHLLRLAHEEWEVLDVVPRVRMEREAEGRLRWLTPEDATRLLAACGESRNGDLTDLMEFALFTGLRRGEVLDLTWERVDRARGVILLDVTKSGKRREVPLNSRADAVLARRGSKSGGGLVFGTRKWDHFRSAWERAVDRAKLWTSTSTICVTRSRPGPFSGAPACRK